jgi:hypothetical protein
MHHTPIRQSLLLTCLMLLPATAFSQALEHAIETQVQTDVAAQRSQQQIDELDDEARDLLMEYRQVLQQTQSLKSYNDQLDKLVASQQQERLSIEQQLNNIETTQRDITPLMLRMIEVMEQFVALDIPFLPDERAQRLAQLEALMERADINLSEKYRRILEAYQVETEYGRTIEAYQGELKTDDATRTVNFLRIGRVNLYYLTLDERESGVWDQQTQAWHTLPRSENKAVAQGLKVALKQLPPDLLILPVKTIGGAQ